MTPHHGSRLGSGAQRASRGPPRSQHDGRCMDMDSGCGDRHRPPLHHGVPREWGHSHVMNANIPSSGHMIPSQYTTNTPLAGAEHNRREQPQLKSTVRCSLYCDRSISFRRGPFNSQPQSSDQGALFCGWNFGNMHSVRNGMWWCVAFRAVGRGPTLDECTISTHHSASPLLHAHSPHPRTHGHSFWRLMSWRGTTRIPSTCATLSTP